MTRALTQTLLATLFVASAAFAARAQSAPQKSDPPPPRATVRLDSQSANILDTGKLEGGTYSNGFFGLSFMLPEGWFVLDVADNKKLLNKGRQAVEESVPEKKKARLEASLARTSFLLSAAKHKLGTPHPEPNAMFLCVAERVPTNLIKTGADYLSAGQRSFTAAAGTKLEFVGPMRTEKVGGVEFTVVELKLSLGSSVRIRRQYVRIMKGHALSLTYIYIDDADLKILDELLGTVKFQ